MAVTPKKKYSDISLCPVCNKEIDVLQSKVHKGKCYHLDCYKQKIEQTTTGEEKQKSEDEIALYKYVAKLFALPAVTPTLNKQINEYLSRGYTHWGILKTLQYVYDLLEWDLPSGFDYPSLKVIDYKYDEAKEFWEKKEALKDKMKTFDPKTAVVETYSKVRQPQKAEVTKELEYIDIDKAISDIEKNSNTNIEDETMIEYRKNVKEIKQEFDKKTIG